MSPVRTDERDHRPSRPLLLRRARAVLPDRVAERVSITVSDGLIADVSEQVDGDAGPAAEARDLEGLTVYPGFIDMHTHGAAGVDTLEASAEDLRRVARFLASRGVTAWLPTLVPAPDETYARAARAVAELMRTQDDGDDARPVARALGIHYEGPFVNVAQCGALRTKYFKSYARPSDLDALAAVAHEGAVHMTTLAPEVEGGVELVRELRSRGWVASIGHTRADVATLERARLAGARHMTHFMNAMPQLHHRSPGPVGWGLAREDVTCDIIADGVHLDPLAVRLVVRCKGADSVALISDSVAPAGLGDGDYALWGETISVSSGRTSNARGSIAGSVIALDEAARLVSALASSPVDVARMASTTPARVLGVEGEYGSIEVGRRADLVALDDGGRVRLTLVGGRVAFGDAAH
jgi:N-acetylglucosamine-6-phosphate deacetylase